MASKRMCKWHHCQKGRNAGRAMFLPARIDQDFCSTACRKARAAWRQNRGSTLVDPLIDGKWSDLRKMRAALLEETDHV